MTPRQFLESVVQPNVAEFHNKFESVRLAYNAVWSVDALASHIFQWCLTNAPQEVAGFVGDQSYKKHLGGTRDKTFGLTHDLANALKHVRLTRTRNNPDLGEARQMSSRPIAYSKDNGQPVGVRQVVIDFPDGKLQYVEIIVDLALIFLEGEMDRLRI